jgi:hypothetical protein
LGEPFAGRAGIGQADCDCTAVRAI